MASTWEEYPSPNWRGTFDSNGGEYPPFLTHCGTNGRNHVYVRCQNRNPTCECPCHGNCPYAEMVVVEK